MFLKLGCPIAARYMFDSMSERNVVSWNAMIFAYSSNGLVEEAIQLFNLMRRSLSVDTFTIMSLVSAAFGAGDLQIVTQIHGLVVKYGHDNSQRVESGLIEMYIDVHCVDDAYCIFCEMPVKDVVAWTLMLTGFVKSGNWNKAVEHFNQMLIREEVELDSVALIGILSGCGSSGALQQGRRVHALVIKFGFEGDTFLGSSIVDMYANCAKLGDGRRFFEGMAEKDAACWNALVAGNGMHGYGNDAIDLFLKMKDLGIDPNESTLVCVLSACGHAGLVDQGLYIFENMTSRWNLFPNQKPYACVVDLLGRVGRLNDAYSVINNMHLQLALDVYGALLGACKAHGNIELGVEVSQRLLVLKPHDPGYYILFSNIYALSGNLEIQEEGYVPDLTSVYQDVADDLKKDILYHHSEKLAIAFGLMRTTPGTIIRVTKNLRACNDCHSSFAYDGPTKDLLIKKELDKRSNLFSFPFSYLGGRRSSGWRYMLDNIVSSLLQGKPGKVPKDCIALRMLAEEMTSWPNLEAKATDTGVNPKTASMRLNLDRDSAAEIEEADESDDPEVPAAVGYGALYLVSAFPIIIGISVVLILFYSSLQ
ncbi:hypothetical protein RND71_034038 [Anisodus tanguticus]|uniref:DYW domain-containing protein n=1 Tax=Anisodus tanguticus TaxID=243964 RepID=A0AAE1R8U1_9SOLA|nr:hypothetical protein RND71_034038 [Anisodus tanguticus]